MFSPIAKAALARGCVRPAAAALALTAAVALVGGCASGPAAGAEIATEAPNPFAELDALASRQARAPDRTAMAAPAPPGVQPQTQAPESERARADQPLAEVAASYAGRLGEVAGEPIVDSDAPADQRREAVRLYVAGRAKLLSGEIREAIADLRDATRLDPSAAAPWRELGEAALASGDRFTALASFRQALRRDPDDLESLVRLGLMLADRGASEEAAIALSRARLRLDDRDAALPFLVNRALGESLLALGAFRASAEALRAAVSLPERGALPTRFSREATQLERDRSVVWRRLGDALLAQGALCDALDAYRRALALPNFDPASLRASAAHVAMRLGRSAAAARLALDGLITSSGQVDERALELLQFVAHHSGIQPQIARAVDALIAAQPVQARVRAEGALALARSAILSGEDAVDALVERLRSSPADSQALWALRRRLADQPADRQVEVFAQLTAFSPMRAEQYATALLHSDAPASAFLDALAEAARSDGPTGLAAALLRAQALALLGREAESAQAIEALASRGPSYAPALYEQALLAVRRGDLEAAAPIIRALSRAKAPSDRLLHIAALEAAHRPDEARRAVDALLADDSIPRRARSDALLLAASIAERWGDADRARRLLLELVELDPAREEAYAGLIALHAPAGADPNPQRLADAVRALREAAPSSRLLRWLHAQDLVREDRLDQAERELLDLARERLEPNIAVMLTNIWLRAGAIERARDWLEERIKALPNMPSLHAALARVMAEADAPARAADMLFARLEEHPQHDGLLRTLESILRDKLGQEIEADRLALRRLEAQPRSPEALAERAGALLRLGRAGEAVEPLRDALAWNAPLRPTQGAAITRQIAALAQSALSQGEPQLAHVAELFDALAQRVAPLPLQAHLARLEIALRSEEVDAAKMGDTLELAMDQHEAQASQLALTILGRALEADRSALAATLAARANEILQQPDVSLHAVWLQAAANAADLNAVRAALEAIESGATALAIVERLRNFEPRPAGETAAVAELAYQVAGSFYPDNEPAYEAMLRFALARDPDHALANNDLGYQMADRGERLEEAHRMLRKAYALAPQRSAIVDSLGWVRYKLGILEDQTLPDGDRIDGAVALLRKASQMAGGSSDPVVRDHLGDALWRMGQVDEAVNQWRIAKAVAQSRMAQQPRIASVDQQVLEQAQRKMDAVAEGRRPPVAPMQHEAPALDAASKPQDGAGANH